MQTQDSSSRSSLLEMLPPPRPATSFRTVDYRELLNLKAQLGRYQFQSATLKAHLAHARELLDWISPRRWKEMQQVSTEAEKGRVSWTEAIGKYLQKAVANPRKTLPLFVGVLYQFKRICSARLKRQSCRPEGLGNLHRYVNALPEPSSDDIRCTKRALLRLQQRHFAKLFLHEDEHGSNIDTILSHLKETAFLIKGADNLLSEDATIEEENEAADCLDKADDQAKGICDLCQAVLGLDWVNVCTFVLPITAASDLTAFDSLDSERNRFGIDKSAS
ncbi:hypothetical protein JCM3765_006890 [Sporobolomyces pararoseus]